MEAVIRSLHRADKQARHIEEVNTKTGQVQEPAHACLSVREVDRELLHDTYTAVDIPVPTQRRTTGANVRDAAATTSPRKLTK